MAIRFRRVERLCDPTDKAAGRSVNISGLGYFFLSAESKGAETAEDFTVADISGLRICFRANSDIRLQTGGAARTNVLKFKDLDHINKDSDGNGNNSDIDDSGDKGDLGDGGKSPDPTL